MQDSVFESVVVVVEEEEEEEKDEDVVRTLQKDSNYILKYDTNLEVCSPCF
jgi:hypothetical protein